MQKFEITKAEGGTAFLVQVAPGAGQNRITRKDKDIVYIELVSAAEQKAVDQELGAFLAQKLAVKQEKIAIASGNSVEKKIVIIMGLTPEEIEARLAA